MTSTAEEALRTTTAHLAAAISLLERGGKKAAPSDKIFRMMLADYKKALAAGREALKALPRTPKVQP